MSRSYYILTDKERAKIDEIKYWLKQSEEAETDGAALVAYGVSAGLRMSLTEKMRKRVTDALAETAK